MGSSDHFTQRFLAKSDHELQAIINSNQHVEKAKHAAKRILEERGNKVDFIEPVQQPVLKNESRVFRLLGGIKDRKHSDPLGLVIFGLMVIVSAVSMNYQNLTTSKNQLVLLQGSVKSAKVIVDEVSVRGRYGKVHESRRARLYFSLFEHQKLFILAENIGDDFEHKEYESISKSLNRSASAIISINRSEMSQFSPKVFQIEVDNRILLDFKSVKREYEGLLLIMFLLGLALITQGLYLKWPNKFRKVVGLK